MTELRVRTEDTTKRVQQAAQQAAFRNFGHAGASISRDIKRSLVRAAGPSPAGEPPHTHRGTALKNAIRFAADEEGAIIGPVFSIVEDVGAVHEFGEAYKGADYDERPFVGPGLERGIPRFAGDWQGSIGE